MIRACSHLIGDHTLVLTLQNGLGNIEILGQYVPHERLFAGVTIFGTELLTPGKIQALGTGTVELMRVDGQESETLKQLVDTLNLAGMNVTVSKDVIKTIWSKVAFNSALNPLCALMESTVGQVGSYGEINIVIDGIVSEIVAVGLAEGVEIKHAHIVNMVKNVFDPKMSGNHYPSMCQDMENGRQTEIDYLNGEIVRRGDKHGIAVPYNRLITHLIRLKEQTRLYK
jgi:2-dehydropantoate 2-reductase